jgi:hypothetical protein
MEPLFEIAKTVGSLSGIFASAVLIWDRYAKHFPVAIIVARPLSHGSSQIVPFLLVKNVSDRPILITWNAGDSSRLRLAKDQSARGIMRGITALVVEQARLVRNLVEHRDSRHRLSARIGVMRALNRHDVREFNTDRKDTHWGKRKLKRDE